MFLFAGCSGCGDDNKGKPDAAEVDASTCTVPSSFSTVTMQRLFYKADRDTAEVGNQEEWKTLGQLDATPKRDLLWIELFEGPAPDYTTADFPATPFTITLTGAETDYVKCSTCISITSDADAATLGPTKVNYVDDYMATSGTVTITTLTPTSIEGTLNNIVFTHSNITAAGTTPNASGCTSTLASLSFSGAVTANATGIAIELGSGKRPLR